MTTYTVTTDRIPEQVEPGRRLGRQVHHDSRSRAYAVQARGTDAVRTVEWTRHTPILRQSIGACVGNALIGAMGSDPHYATLAGDGCAFDETAAVDVYSAATKVDSIAGTYPPDDHGTNALAACKVAQSRGWISGYRAALGLDAALTALMSGPVLVGIGWWSSMDHPDSDGIATVSADAHLRGGHEVLARRVDADRRLVGLDNSWGVDWGDHGSFWLSWDTLDQLLAQKGDVYAPVPLTQAPPTPRPTVDPEEADRALWDALKGWTTAPHVGSNKAAATAVAGWATERGYR